MSNYVAANGSDNTYKVGNSVRFLSETIGLAILRDLISIADGRSTTAD